MKKFVMTIILANAVLWYGLTTLASKANAGEYSTAVIGHVITNHDKIDPSTPLS